jgi:hypothetical protein
MIDLVIPMIIADISKWLIIAAVICVVLCIIYLDLMITGGVYTLWSAISWICYGIIFVIIMVWGALTSPDSSLQVINIIWSK